MPADKLIHRGVWYDTRANIDDPVGKREKAFADAWEEENQPRGHFSRAWGPELSTLQALMRKDDNLVPVSQETATAVATVVQWLGTPIGWGFLEGALRQAGYVVLTKEEYKKLCVARGPHG